MSKSKSKGYGNTITTAGWMFLILFAIDAAGVRSLTLWEIIWPLVIEVGVLAFVALIVFVCSK